MFVTGACGFIYECIMGAVSAYILGNSVEQFSVVMGLMMFMMAVAGAYQRLLSDDRLIEKFILIETLLALFGGFAPLAVYAAFGLMDDHFNLVLYGSVLVIGFLIGLEIPLAMRINEKYVRSLGSNIASIWSFDYIGGLVGSLLFALVLIKLLPLTHMSFVVAAANFAVAVMTLAFFARRKLVERPAITLAALSITLVLLLVGGRCNITWSDRLEQKLYDDPIVLAETTRYQRLVMTHRPAVDEYRFYINGNLQFSSLDEAIYHENLIHPVMNLVPDHARVLILGGGDGLALREVLKYRDVESVTLVDLDPDMIKLCSTNPILTRLNHNSFGDARVHAQGSTGITSTRRKRTIYQETGRMVKSPTGAMKPEVNSVAEVDVYNVDADLFIARTPEKWNVVIVDLPDPTSVELAKLYSKEFYVKVHRLLAENGMLTVQSTSPYHAKEAYLCILDTIGAAGFHTLPYHDNVPSFGDWGWMLAWKNQTTPDAIRKRIAELPEFPVPTSYLTPDGFLHSLTFGKGWLEPKHNDISTLMQPIILQRYLDDSWKVE